MVTLSQQALILQHALRDFPNECCGLIVNDLHLVIPCVNESHDTRNNFLINPRTIERVANECGIAGIYHSHIGSMALPSSGDLEQCMWYEVPYLIVAVWPGNKTELRAYMLTDDFGRKHFRGTPEILCR